MSKPFGQTLINHRIAKRKTQTRQKLRWVAPQIQFNTQLRATDEDESKEEGEDEEDHEKQDQYDDEDNNGEDYNAKLLVMETFVLFDHNKVSRQVTDRYRWATKHASLVKEAYWDKGKNYHKDMVCKVSKKKLTDVIPWLSPYVQRQLQHHKQTSTSFFEEIEAIHAE
ncbi:hypothetical protein Cgig2_001890 [Carnegiea gigantea]|uniref:Uncharacterized protein n=1 Tax=Carnegiea gigantea TaxID=171969 RepID=A0A9Q1JKA7_9CARY|nr:hypothetical protein Cgig2_001890 [Carnegiea gigantea]